MSLGWVLSRAMAYFQFALSLTVCGSGSDLGAPAPEACATPPCHQDSTSWKLPSARHSWSQCWTTAEDRNSDTRKADKCRVGILFPEAREFFSSFSHQELAPKSCCVDRGGPRLLILHQFISAVTEFLKRALLFRIFSFSVVSEILNFPKVLLLSKFLGQSTLVNINLKNKLLDSVFQQFVIILLCS